MPPTWLLGAARRLRGRKVAPNASTRGALDLAAKASAAAASRRRGRGRGDDGGGGRDDGRLLRAVGDGDDDEKKEEVVRTSPSSWRRPSFAISAAIDSRLIALESGRVLR
jgi:hypothetical protein